MCIGTEHIDIQADCVSHLLLEEALLLLLLLLVDGGRVRRRECRRGHILSWRGHHVSGLMRRGRRRVLERHRRRINGCVSVTGVCRGLPDHHHVTELGAQIILLTEDFVS